MKELGQEIEFEIIKVSSNKIYSGTHWNERNNLKNDYISLTNNSFRKLIPIDYKVNLDFKFYFKGRCLDSSNNSFMVKMIEDCLIKHKILKNDTIKYVGKVSMESFKGEKDCCKLSITKCKEFIKDKKR